MAAPRIPLFRPPVPVVTLVLAAVCIAVFLYQSTLDRPDEIRLLLGYGFLPERLFGESYGFDRYAMVPGWASLFTSLFLHAGVLHLAFNMICLVSFGLSMERWMGAWRFALLFFAAGAAGGVLHAFATDDLRIPVIGASGAIFGILAMATIAFPGMRIALVVIPMPLWVAMLLAAVAHVVFIATDWVEGVAWWGHVGGAIAGAVLWPLLRPRRLPPRY